ncbi:MAG: FAD-dependent oxidoreductase, partial [Candidatus Aureabacteria bacterium]|nr:FAD-dependent oxidoreductase [Candidatus Auribacterota bacterium]
MYNLPEMPSVQDREIIIIGAGPAGSTAAYDLARAGRRPLLLEKDRIPGEKNACAGGIAYLMKDHLSLPEEVVDKEIHVTRLSCRGKTKDYRTTRPQYISVQRRVFDKYLAFR